MLIYADGQVNPKEIESAKQMMKEEGISEPEFFTEIEWLKSKDKGELFDETIASLKKLTHAQQIKIVAWLCVVANADGFMDRTEWQLIYNIYHKQLALPLNEIFAVQKELTKLIWDRKIATYGPVSPGKQI
jgi:uncharacterized tellurite resistance protein B-like protein